MQPIGYVGRIPEGGYPVAVSAAKIITNRHKLETVGSHASFIEAAFRVQVEGTCYFTLHEANLFQAFTGSSIKRG